MRFGIVWSQESTKRGAIWLGGASVAFLFLIYGTVEKAMAAITITGMLAGGLGLAVKDSGNERA